MKIYYLLFLGLSPIYAEYTTEYLMETGNAIYSETKAQTLRLIPPQTEEKESDKKAHLDEVWSDAFGELSEGAKYIIKLDKAPNSAWLEPDKIDIQEDINDILDNMIEILIADELKQYTRKITKLQENITENQKKNNQL